MARPLSPLRLVIRRLEESTTPVFALDAGRRIVFANRSLGHWLGLEPEQLIGRRCDFHAGGDDPLQTAAAGLCPPPEAFSGQAETGFVSRLCGAAPAEGGRFERRPVRYVHLAAGQPGEELLLLVVLRAASGAADAAASHVDRERLHGLLAELHGKLGQRFAISQLIGESEAIAQVREQVRLAAKDAASVLIIGPPGSGREHVARTIHYADAPAVSGPLAPIACDLVDAEQMQAALTSLLRRQREPPAAERAADPNPCSPKAGCAAGRATALLLNVDRLRPDAQQELAGFLELPNIELRTLATSRVSLLRLAARGKFHRHLAYALSTLTIRLPPLRDRRQDIPLLAQHFVEAFNADGGRQLSGFAPAAIELLAGLPWPRNLDELAQAVCEACQRSTGPQIRVADLPDWVHLAKTAATCPPRRLETIELDAFLAEIEKELLTRALRAARGNKSKAAQLLGINRPRLLRRLSQLGLIPATPEAAEEPVIFEPLQDDADKG